MQLCREINLARALFFYGMSNYTNCTFQLVAVGTNILSSAFLGLLYLFVWVVSAICFLFIYFCCCCCCCCCFHVASANGFFFHSQTWIATMPTPLSQGNMFSQVWLQMSTAGLWTAGISVLFICIPGINFVCHYLKPWYFWAEAKTSLTSTYITASHQTSTLKPR